MAEKAKKSPSSDVSAKDQTSLKEFPMLLLKGFLMGSADVVPGVSGGTMALILGIYERLLSAIKSVSGSVVKDVLTFRLMQAAAQVHILFMVMLFSGIATALAFFTKVVPLQVYMFTHPEIVFGLFFWTHTRIYLCANKSHRTATWKYDYIYCGRNSCRLMGSPIGTNPNP